MGHAVGGGLVDESFAEKVAVSSFNLELRAEGRWPSAR
jgi:hypothetical protein